MGRAGLWGAMIVVVLGTSACGFEPMYGRPRGTNPMTTPVASELAAIRVYGIHVPADSKEQSDARLAQDLRNRLVYSLTPYGEPARPRYGLSVNFQGSLGYLAPSKDGYTTITQNNLSASYSLINMADGKILKTGTVRTVNSARSFGPRYASIAAERDIEETNVTELAQGITSQLSGWFATPANRVGRPIVSDRQPLTDDSSAAPTPPAAP